MIANELVVGLERQLLLLEEEGLHSLEASKPLLQLGLLLQKPSAEAFCFCRSLLQLGLLHKL
jgi:hypothetical protein